MNLVAVSKWQEKVVDVAAHDLDRGWKLILDGLGEIVEAAWGFVVVATRQHEDVNDPLQGWRVFRTLLPSTHPDQERANEWAAGSSLLDDPFAQRIVAAHGAHRALRIADVLAEGEFDTTPGRQLYDDLGGISDQLCGVHSLHPAVEIYFGFLRAADKPTFTEMERNLLRFAMPGLRRPCRWLALSLGGYPDQMPLSVREREALSHLLGPAPEKIIADRMGLRQGSCHQLVVRVYRKLGVASRAELMAKWLESDA